MNGEPANGTKQDTKTINGTKPEEKPRVFEPVPILPKEKRNLGQKAADYLTEFGGSWKFILLFFGFLIVWIIINLYAVMHLKWDPYPFILLNLVLSCLAAIQAPVILMSQNRTAQRDRIKAERDYYVNRKAEKEIQMLQIDFDVLSELNKNQKTDLNEIKDSLKKLQISLDEIKNSNNKTEK